MKSIGAASTPTEAEKVWLRYFIAWHVLGKLGFGEERIRQCLEEGVGDNEGWEEGLEWVGSSSGTN
jgi:hypothetical protein